MVVPFAALASLKIELQRDRILHRRDGGFDRRLGEHRPAKICVEDRAAQVEQRARAQAVLPLETGATFEGEPLSARSARLALLQRRARDLDRRANRIGRGFLAIKLE